MTGPIFDSSYRPIMLAKRFHTLLAGLLLAGGCASVPPAESGPAFVFPEETFAFANELIAVYKPSPDGRLRMKPREVPAEYGQNCLAMIRAARLFHAHARFAPELPRASQALYQERTEAVLTRNPRKKRPVADPVVIPGYSNLYAFSQGEETLLRIAVDDRLGAYFQRGNWRMINPFTRGHQAQTAEAILSGVRRGEPPVVHVVRFPEIAINHMVLVYAALETPDEIFFQFYDPNYPDDRLQMRYDRSRRSFEFPRNDFFSGGPVRAYEIYDGLFF